MQTEFKPTTAQQIYFIKGALYLISNEKNEVVLREEHAPMLSEILENLLAMQLVEHSFEGTVRVHIEADELNTKYDKLLQLCEDFINSNSYVDHKEKIEMIIKVVAEEKQQREDANQTMLEFENDEEVINDEITSSYSRHEEAERMYKIQRDLK